MQAWQDIGWFGTRYPVYDAPWWNVPVWDTSSCCASNIAQNKFFGLMNALFGYSARPRPRLYLHGGVSLHAGNIMHAS